ncbi:Piso0_001933 [Millerozyma farinosa CBS 7064]|uniref:Piso0_001933 protein n=1 Tax=Pichia sorbitophila (strain ATCC MYA-4447 / BCRC 22081 / CBS 7064 / NBRC 10061 / NRRL Y-12695) TaxID=559304 RepID=G8YB89_PICSO|nr:Piso0_001933 [Millerozyma farinosa CBS 7064]
MAKKSKGDRKGSHPIDERKKSAFTESLYNIDKNKSKSFYLPQPKSLAKNQIVVIEKFFNADICNELISSFQSSDILGLETTELQKSKEYAARVNDRALVTDFEAANSLWNYLQNVLLQRSDYDDDDDDINDIRNTFSDAVCLNPRLRIYRYRRGHYFGQHYDDSVSSPITNSSEKKTGLTKWTLLIYLTGGEEFKGGGTVFYFDDTKDSINFHPSKGAALLHKHGDDCLRHEGELITEGVKWVLRSDVVYKN